MSKARMMPPLGPGTTIAKVPAPRSTSAATSSCSTVAEESGSTDLGSSTPPTSATDASSITSKGSVTGDHTPDATHVLRTRRSHVGSYRESILSGTSRRHVSTDTRNRTISGETLVDGHPSRQLLGEGIKALDLEWRIATSPDAVGAAAETTMAAAALRRRRSTRAHMVQMTKAGVKGGLTALGKRGRAAVDAGRDGAREVAHGLRAGAAAPSATEKGASATDDGPAKKKPRASADTIQRSPTLTSQRSKKRWLSSGLYVGQTRGFNPRFTEAKNKLKAASLKVTDATQRSIMPLPMFGGERLLETGRNFRLPFDVYAPLPPGQPKPDEWRKKQKNVFVGDAAAFWKNTKLPEMSKCLCPFESGCDEDCQNRHMFYECDDSNCSIGADRCTNRPFEQLQQRYKAGGKYNIGVEVIKTEGKGYGVRSNRTFEPHQIIVEYTGEIITQDECETRMKTIYKQNECYYLMLFDQNMIIDATRGSIARFVNHSCEPNCKMVKWTVAGKPRMALFAGEHGVMSGEELSYDYNFDPFSVKNVQQCRCGSSQCRGVLGPRPKEPKTVLANIIGQAKSAKRKMHDLVTGDENKPLKNAKKRKVLVPKAVQAAAVRAGGSLRGTSTARVGISTSRRSVDSATSPRKGGSLRGLSKARVGLSTGRKSVGALPAPSRPGTSASNTATKTSRRSPGVMQRRASAPLPPGATRRSRVMSAAGTLRRSVQRTVGGPRPS
ncbi:MAG: hypothetical protein M1838_003167 [Thelocarpon superellum]|nr:MAG: hypothetical protein M1838_003167 [Thelocarpon superellum]